MTTPASRAFEAWRRKRGIVDTREVVRGQRDAFTAGAEQMRERAAEVADDHRFSDFGPSHDIRALPADEQETSDED